MPPDEDNLFEQGYIPYIQIDNNTRRTRPKFVFNESYQNFTLEIYLISTSGASILIYREDLSRVYARHEYRWFSDWWGVEQSVNNILNLALNERITDLHRLSRMFGDVEGISRDAANTLSACVADMVSNQIESEQQVLMWGDTPTQDYTQELLDRIREAEVRVGITPLEIDDPMPEQEYERWEPPTHRLTFADRLKRLKRKPDNTLVEAEPTPFSDEELDTLLFEGA